MPQEFEVQSQGQLEFPVPSCSQADLWRLWTWRRLCVAMAVLGPLASPDAHAVDGCQVLLCLAAPSWHKVSQCVPPVQQLMHDLAMGKPFPVCDMSGPGNGATEQASNAPTDCPPQYTLISQGVNGPTYDCQYAGSINIQVNGDLWSRTWWDFSGGSVTEFTTAAKSQLGTWDTRFDDDYAAWLAAQPPAPAPCNC